jgi:hypothetical protein
MCLTVRYDNDSEERICISFHLCILLHNVYFAFKQSDFSSTLRNIESFQHLFHFFALQSMVEKHMFKIMTSTIFFCYMDEASRNKSFVLFSFPFRLTS